MRFQYHRVGDVIEEIAMGPFGSNIKIDCFVSSGVPVLNGSNLNGFTLNENSFNYVTPEKASSLKKAVASRGDIVITHRGTLGQIVYIPASSNHDKYVISQSQFRVRCKESVMLPEFMVYFFHSREGQHKLLSNSSQVGVPALARPSSTFQELEIPVPPMKEQQTIVNALSALNARIASNRAINHHLEQMAQAIYKSWFVDFEPWGGVMPYNWRISNIGEVCDVKGGKRLPKGGNLTTIPNAHPYIRVRDMNNALFVQMTSDVEYVPTEIQQGISRYIVSENDVIISIVGTIGLVCIVHPSLSKANLTENCAKLTNNKGVSSSWLYLFLSSDGGQEQIRNGTVGAVQSKLPIKNIQSISFTLPPIDVMYEFDGAVSGLLEAIANNYTENSRLAALRDTLLPRLMSGELSVADLAAK